MKCSVGCMALVIKSNAGNAGKVVTCEENVGCDALVGFGTIRFRLGGGPWWRLDRGLNLVFNDVTHTDVFPFARDDALMPINGNEVKQKEKETELV